MHVLGKYSVQVVSGNLAPKRKASRDRFYDWVWKVRVNAPGSSLDGDWVTLLTVRCESPLIGLAAFLAAMRNHLVIEYKDWPNVGQAAIHFCKGNAILWWHSYERSGKLDEVDAIADKAYKAEHLTR